MLPQPNVVVSSDDYKRLSSLLDELPESAAVDRLVDELERAEVIENAKLPTGLVKMHSRVTFTIISKQKTFTYTLVYPHEATKDDTLSILTPVGSALLGLSVGQEIEWPLEENKTTRVRIDSVEH